MIEYFFAGFSRKKNKQKKTVSLYPLRKSIFIEVDDDPGFSGNFIPFKKLFHTKLTSYGRLHFWKFTTHFHGTLLEIQIFCNIFIYIFYSQATSRDKILSKRKKDLVSFFYSFI